MRIEHVTRVAAPPERCFDLARDVDLHLASAAATGERVVAGVSRGLLGAGDEVTWEARHLGRRWRLRVRITTFDPPRHFRDEMVSGPFARFVHDHYVEGDGDAAIMRDVVDFASPLGPLGRAADRLVVGPHLSRFLRRRAEAIRRAAEEPPP